MREMEVEIDRLLALQQFEEKQRNQNWSDSDSPYGELLPMSTGDTFGSISPLYVGASRITSQDNPMGEAYIPSVYSPFTFGRFSDVEDY